LPSIATKDIDSLIKEKFAPNKISEELELYASIIDLNKTTPEILEQNRHGMTDDELKKLVLPNIFLSLEVKWKREVEMIHIMQYSAYEQKGVCGSLKDVVAIN
jgi:hypothetical protein